MKIFTNHRYALITGIVLAVVLSVVLTHSLVPPDSPFNHLSLARWVHIVSGVFWIGLLYYFNAVQTPGLADAAADKGGPGGAGVNKYIAPRALFWFRWAALATWVAGAWLLDARFVNAFTLSLLLPEADYQTVVIGIGAWLGTIMLFNVWGLIWPNQKKILGIVPATDEEKAQARKTALYASRTNFILSFPMLMCMAATSHGLPI
ncbi:MAG TPA: urate hydroxylase PuuD [Steroidobacteraceae bacterium]|nr:urate hydroxylase PuuD [Steroidobacteraceae bacterium]